LNGSRVRPALAAALLRPALAAALLVTAACDADGRGGGSGGAGRCGPETATVSRVIDGDTVELSSGERVRYLLVDTNELSSNDCFATEARDFNVSVVAGREVELTYDEECTDDFGRLLAYVRVGDRDLNALLVERGYACVLFIPPNGTERVDELRALERIAESERQGMWGACEEVACD